MFQRGIIGTLIVFGIIIVLHFLPGFIEVPFERLEVTLSVLQKICIAIALFYLPGRRRVDVFFEENELTSFEAFVYALMVGIGLSVVGALRSSKIGGSVEVVDTIIISFVLVTIAIIIGELQSNT